MSIAHAVVIVGVLQDLIEEEQGDGGGDHDIYQEVKRVGGHIRPQRHALHFQQHAGNDVYNGVESSEAQAGKEDLAVQRHIAGAGAAVKIK